MHLSEHPSRARRSPMRRGRRGVEARSRLHGGAAASVPHTPAGPGRAQIVRMKRSTAAGRPRAAAHDAAGTPLRSTWFIVWLSTRWPSRTSSPRIGIARGAVRNWGPPRVRRDPCIHASTTKNVAETSPRRGNAQARGCLRRARRPRSARGPCPGSRDRGAAAARPVGEEERTRAARMQRRSSRPSRRVRPGRRGRLAAPEADHAHARRRRRA